MALSHAFAEDIEELLQVAKGKNESSVPRNCTWTKIELDSFYAWYCLPAILIPLTLGIFMQRHSFQRHRCRGRPGLAIPMNVLDMRHTRFAYIIAFGVTIPTILSVVNTDTPPFVPHNAPKWATILMKLVTVVIYGTVWYPLFAAISAETILGYVLATLYVMIYLIVVIYNQVACANLTTESATITMKALEQMPLYFFLILMIIYFLVMTALQLRVSRSPSQLAREKEGEMMAEYVRELLSSKCRYKGRLEKALEQFQLSGFMFPPRLLCSLVVAALVLYTLALQFLFAIGPSFDFSKMLLQPQIGNDNRSIEQVVQTMLLYNRSDPLSMMTVGMDICRVTQYFLNVSEVCLLLSTSVALVISIFQFPFVLINYRKNVLMAYKGQYPIIKRPAAVSAEAAIMGFSRYAGYQAAYLFWGFVIQNFCLFMFFVIFAVTVVSPIKFGFINIWSDVLKPAWPLYVIPFIISVSQTLVTRYFFIQRPGKLIAVDNRQVFFIWSYYSFFYNIFLGLFSCFNRISTSLIIGLEFVGRIDVSVLPHLYESNDPGFTAYCGFVHTEIAHNNPILRTFINILLERGHVDRLPSEYRERTISILQLSLNMENGESDSEELVSRSLRSKQLQFRWQLLYTLYHNESIRRYRKHYISMLKVRIDRKLNTFGNHEVNGAFSSCTAI